MTKARRLEVIASRAEILESERLAEDAPPATPRPPPDRSKPSVSGNVAPDKLSPFAQRQRYSAQRLTAIAAAKARSKELRRG